MPRKQLIGADSITREFRRLHRARLSGRNCDMKRSLILEPLTRSVIGAFYEVYNRLGFGFLESIYMNAL